MLENQRQRAGDSHRSKRTESISKESRGADLNRGMLRTEGYGMKQ